MDFAWGFQLCKSPPEYQDIADFNEGVQQAHLEDLNCTRCRFTWTNKQEEGARKWMKLDRAIANIDWITRFPNTSAHALEPGVSDHSPIVVDADCGERYYPKMFKFLNCWTHHSLFQRLVEAYMNSVLHCQRNLKKDLKQLHKEHFSSITDRVVVIWDQLRSCQQAIQLDPLNTVLKSLTKEQKFMILKWGC
ncbi:uncharacterized protein LOC141651266 [Silene latifolia]|uniref:uncharacterized protein LOC141651266 n=1 Tax=Silene latifolia TaxID=37657 RepID=UPI003D779410